MYKHRCHAFFCLDNCLWTPSLSNPIFLSAAVSASQCANRSDLFCAVYDESICPSAVLVFPPRYWKIWKQDTQVEWDFFSHLQWIHTYFLYVIRISFSWSEQATSKYYTAIPTRAILDFNRSFTLWAWQNGWLIDCTDLAWIQPQASISAVFMWTSDFCDWQSTPLREASASSTLNELSNLRCWTALMCVYLLFVQSNHLLLCCDWSEDYHWSSSVSQSSLNHIGLVVAII